jgi:hypothetical protein
VIGLYYYGDVTMKQIGAAMGVNESRVSQLHARAIRRLRDALGEMNPQKVAEMRRQLIAFAVKKPAMAKVEAVKPAAAASSVDAASVVRANPTITQERVAQTHAVVLPYQAAAKKRVVVGKAQLSTRRRTAIAAAR